MNIPEGYKLVPVEATRAMIDAGIAAYERDDSYAEIFASMAAAAPQPPAFDGEPPVIAYAAFSKNGNIRYWSRTNENVGLKILAEGGSRIVELIDLEYLRFHVHVSEHVEAHLTKQIDIVAADRDAARMRVERMTEALALVATLRGTLETHGMLQKVEEALGRYQQVQEAE